jgi:large subunit ribosomal protein L15|tara:strand:- start:1124 stop:1543 length:420 start_codon:yes stop_codon:yes gene_type:complete
MPTRLRKIRKQRGTRFHGWGQVGQHRSTGMKGGSGKAGLLKHKWTWTVKYDPNHFGAKGFTPPNQKITKQWINIGQLDDFAVSQAKGKGKLHVIDLNKMGYDKLLGQGQVKGSFKIIVSEFSGNAKTKIEKAGGSIESR